MNDIQYPTLAQVKAMDIPHGKPVAFEWNSSSHGMMACSGESHQRRLEKKDGEVTLTYIHTREAQTKEEKVYRCGGEVFERLTEIVDRENFYAWGKLRIDPDNDPRPRVLDYSGSAAVVVETDIKGANPRNCINWDCADFYGGGEVMKEIREIFLSCEQEENLISENVTELPKPEWMKTMGFMGMGAYAQQGAVKKEEPKQEPQPAPAGEYKEGEPWLCPECNCNESTGRFCVNCGSWRPDLAPKLQPPGVDAPKEVPPAPVSEEKDTAGKASVFGNPPPDEELEGIRNAQCTHGRLVSFTYLTSSSTMMMNSRISSGTQIQWEESGDVTVKTRAEFDQMAGNESVFIAGEEAARELEQLLRRENVAQWSKLAAISPRGPAAQAPFMGVTDMSSSAQYYISYDDSSVGGQRYAMFTVDLATARQHGADGIIDSINDLVSRCSAEGRLLSSKELPAMQGRIVGMGGMITFSPESAAPQPQSDEPAPEGAWKCAACGYSENTGKFCCECGAKREQ